MKFYTKADPGHNIMENDEKLILLISMLSFIRVCTVAIQLWERERKYNAKYVIRFSIIFGHSIEWTLFIGSAFHQEICLLYQYASASSDFSVLLEKIAEIIAIVKKQHF